MQIFGKRYFRDLRRYRVAMQLIKYEVRTQVIALWTGLSEDRVKHFIKEYAIDSPHCRPRRPNGPVLKAVSSLLHPSRCSEAAIAAAYCVAEHAIPPRPGVQSWVCGERVCRAYRHYCRVVVKPRLSCERVMALVVALDKGEDIAFAHCTGDAHCHAAILVDPRSLAPALCSRCQRQQRAATRKCRTRPAGPAMKGNH